MITAKSFYNSISAKSKYKLVNDSLIVRYIDKDVCVLNETNTNRVEIQEIPQFFNKKMGLYTNSRGIWKILNIKFKEKSIKNILKGGKHEKDKKTK